MDYTIIPKQNRYEIIDFAKGFSILTIVLMHFIQNFMNHVPSTVSLAASVGGSGVHVFIFCSGFGLYLSYLRQPVNYLSFLKKRFLRIYIPYIAIILISAITPYMYRGNDKFVAVLSHIFLFKMFIPKYEESFGGQFWFMSTIIQFYLVFMLLCKLKKLMVKKYHFLILSFIISIVYWLFIACIHKESIRVWNSFFLQYLWEFVLGMYLAEMLHKGKSFSVNKICLWFIAFIAIVVMGVMGLLGGTAKIFNDIPALIGYGGICIGFYFWKIGLINKVVLFISSISYELFLIHMIVGKTIFIVFQKEIQGLPSEIIMLMVMLVVSVLVSYLFHCGIKQISQMIVCRRKKRKTIGGM